MEVLFKNRLIVLIPQSEQETSVLAEWKGRHGEHVLLVAPDQGSGLELRDLGHRTDACREPLNIVSDSLDPVCRTISNFGDTPFEINGERFRSVESFWQGLKFSRLEDRRRLAGLEAKQAFSEGQRQGYATTITYDGHEIPVGTWEHWRLMELACRAKFAQNEEARTALLATRERPLVHIVRNDSKAIPGAIMAQIWMSIRRELRASFG